MLKISTSTIDVPKNIARHYCRGAVSGGKGILWPATDRHLFDEYLAHSKTRRIRWVNLWQTDRESKRREKNVSFPQRSYRTGVFVRDANVCQRTQDPRARHRWRGNVSKTRKIVGDSFRRGVDVSSTRVSRKPPQTPSGAGPQTRTNDNKLNLRLKRLRFF